MRCIGIDPGKSGAIALIDGTELINVIDMPVVALKKGSKLCANTLDHALAEMLFSFPDIDLAICEQVHSSPQMGVSSAFDFGRSLGIVEMAIVSRGIRLEWVTPSKWKSALGLNADKSSSLALARAKWPDTNAFARKKDEGRAEACLIAEYARRAGL